MKITSEAQPPVSFSPEAFPSAVAFVTVTVLLIINVVSATVVATMLSLTPPAAVTSKYPRSASATIAVVSVAALATVVSNIFTSIPFLS